MVFEYILYMCCLFVCMQICFYFNKKKYIYLKSS